MRILLVHADKVVKEPSQDPSATEVHKNHKQQQLKATLTDEQGMVAWSTCISVSCAGTEDWQYLSNSVILTRVCQITSVIYFSNSVIHFSNSVIQ